ncbi:hypothetical protein CEXT_603771 [Caerostris extrusa]|uniref:Uncharacterized protein n=1 Tax=Caerostris extrusa TaxID=172846 RepID=A0AAV4MGM2_CAEEX|nr:hypothetical protein CEXT_603771 [Caerostris extrusa]
MRFDAFHFSIRNRMLNNLSLTYFTNGKDTNGSTKQTLAMNSSLQQIFPSVLNSAFHFLSFRNCLVRVFVVLTNSFSFHGKMIKFRTLELGICQDFDVQGLCQTCRTLLFKSRPTNGDLAYHL